LIITSTVLGGERKPKFYGAAVFLQFFGCCGWKGIKEFLKYMGVGDSVSLGEN
jgi:hypothetical protein